MIQLYGIKISKELEIEKFEKLFNIISNNKAQKIKKIACYQDRVQALFSDLLARYSLSKRIKTNLTGIEFEYNEYGKPFIKNHYECQFNLSHSGDWVVAALHKLPVGIDIEQIKDIDLNIAKRFFSALEYQQIINFFPSNQTDFFYDLWSLKESYIKAIGKGLQLPLNSFSMIWKEGKVYIETDFEEEKFFFKQYNIDAGYKMAVCAKQDDFPEVVEVFSIEEFLFLLHKEFDI